MDMTLYAGEPNGPTLTVLAALNETGLPARIINIDLAAGERHSLKEYQTPEVVMSVEGEGPVLVVDDQPLTDSVFIGCFLDEISDSHSLLPVDSYERWQVMTWCRYMIERTAPAAAFLGTQTYLTGPLAELDSSGFTQLIANIGSDDLRDRWQAVRENDFPEEKITDSKNKIMLAVEKIETTLSAQTDPQWIFSRFTLADLESYAWLAGMVDLVPDAFAQAPLTVEWLARVKARPAVQKALASSVTKMPEKNWAPGPEINRWG